MMGGDVCNGLTITASREANTQKCYIKMRQIGWKNKLKKKTGAGKTARELRVENGIQNNHNTYFHGLFPRNYLK